MKAIVVTAIAAAGHSTGPGASRTRENPSNSIEPHDGSGGGTPRPRNDSPASATITNGQVDRGEDDDRTDDVGQDVARRDAPAARSERPLGEHVAAFLRPERRRSVTRTYGGTNAMASTMINEPVETPSSGIRTRARIRPGKAARKSIDEQRARVDAAAAVAARESDREPDHERDGDHGDGQRSARCGCRRSAASRGRDPGDRCRASSRTRALEAARDVLLVRVVRRDPRRRTAPARPGPTIATEPEQPAPVRAS